MHRILIVEDEAMLREAYTILLGAQGYQVDAVVNGLDALDACTRTSYDLILLDLMMPVLDGEGFLRQSNLPQKSPHTKIIVLSNLSFDKMPPHLQDLGVTRQEVKSNLSTRQLSDLVKSVLA